MTESLRQDSKHVENIARDGGDISNESNPRSQLQCRLSKRERQPDERRRAIALQRARRVERHSQQSGQAANE